MVHLRKFLTSSLLCLGLCSPIFASETLHPKPLDELVVSLQSEEEQEVLDAIKSLSSQLDESLDKGSIQNRIGTEEFFTNLKSFIEKGSKGVKESTVYLLGLVCTKNEKNQEFVREIGLLSPLFNLVSNIWTKGDFKIDVLWALCQVCEGNYENLSKLFTKRKVRILTKLVKNNDVLLKSYAARLLTGFAQHAEKGKDCFVNAHTITALSQWLKDDLRAEKKVALYCLYAVLSYNPETVKDFARAKTITPLMEMLTSPIVSDDFKIGALRVVEKSLEVDPRLQEKVFEKYSEDFAMLKTSTNSNVRRLAITILKGSESAEQ